MAEKTGTELMMACYAKTRLDGLVRPLMGLAERYATARCLSYAYGNQHGDENAALQFRDDLEREIRKAMTDLVGRMANAVDKPDPE